MCTDPAWTYADCLWSTYVVLAAGLFSTPFVLVAAFFILGT